MEEWSRERIGEFDRALWINLTLLHIMLCIAGTQSSGGLWIFWSSCKRSLASYEGGRRSPAVACWASDH